MTFLGRQGDKYLVLNTPWKQKYTKLYMHTQHVWKNFLSFKPTTHFRYQLWRKLRNTCCLNSKVYSRVVNYSRTNTTPIQQFRKWNNMWLIHKTTNSRCGGDMTVTTTVQSSSNNNLFNNIFLCSWWNKQNTFINQEVGDSVEPNTSCFWARWQSIGEQRTSPCWNFLIVQLWNKFKVTVDGWARNYKA